MHNTSFDMSDVSRAEFEALKKRVENLEKEIAKKESHGPDTRPGSKPNWAKQPGAGGPSNDRRDG